MDLFSSARRLERPYRFVRDQRTELPLDARAIIGDGITCALVRPDGVIDWMCMPRFDSPSVFGALLDVDRGGQTAVTPVAETFTSLQAYDPGTNVLETIFQVPGQGVARLIDFMPWSDDPRAGIHEIHRRIEVLEGEVELELVFDPRFDYGRDPATLACGPHGVRARGRQGEQFVAVATRADWQPRAAGGCVQRVRLPARTTHWMVLAWSGAEPEPLSHYRSYEHLRATRRAWREWSNRLGYDGPWRHHVMRSALCLKLLTYAPTGAMVAAATTSLPEWIGGVRNWDYRYAWVRDSSFAIRTENLLGYTAEARDFFYFVRDAIDLDRGLDVMYAIDGRRVPAEIDLAHLAGHRGSRPVRVGNGARDQLQLDTVGALVDAAHLYERFGNSLTLASWRKIRAVIQTLRQRVGDPDDGIWEPRSGRRHNVHSKLMSWVALDRGAGLAGAFGEATLRGELLDEAEALRTEILARGLHPDGGHFVAAYDETRVDAALLTLPLYGLVEGDFSVDAPAAPFDQSRIKGVTFGREAGNRLVFVNGRLRSDLSSLKQLSPGIELLSFAEALASRPRLVEAALGNLSDDDLGAVVVDRSEQHARVLVVHASLCEAVAEMRASGVGLVDIVQALHRGEGAAGGEPGTPEGAG